MANWIVVAATKRALPPAATVFVGLQIRRPVSLPKGQSKTFELTYFVADPIDQQKVWLHSDLRLPLGGAVRSVESQPQPTIRLKPYQNEFVVLARRPDAYGYLKTLPSIRPPASGFFNEGFAERLRSQPDWPRRTLSVALVAADVDDGQSSALGWLRSRTAQSDQRQALLDWLHWGGQILVSGPDSLDTLQTSFLATYLPARGGSMRPLQETEVASLNQIGVCRQANRCSSSPQTPPQLIQLELEPGAEFTAGSAEMVAERRVGRGRIVTTAFALTTREFVNWNPGWDNFFNGCLLRRPPRRFRYTDRERLVAVVGEGTGGTADAMARW